MSLFSDVFSLSVHFQFFAVFSYCLYFAEFVCLLKRLQIVTAMAEKSSWEQANIRQKLGLVWRKFIPMVLETREEKQTVLLLL
jgi:hypothetical protein